MRRNECGNCIDQGEWRWWQCGVWTPHCGVGHQECGHQDGSFVRPVATGGSCRNIHRTIQSLCRIWQHFKTVEPVSASQPFGLEKTISITAKKKHLPKKYLRCISTNARACVICHPALPGLFLDQIWVRFKKRRRSSGFKYCHRPH